MVYINLYQQIYKKLHMEADAKENMQIVLDSTFSFNVNYNEDNTECIACLLQNIKCKENPSIFNIVVECLGKFKCDGIENNEDKKQAHVQAYDMLFPYVQSMVQQLAQNGGIPGLLIEKAKLTQDDVMVTDN